MLNIDLYFVIPKLYGDIVKGNEFMSFEFPKEDFKKYFTDEDQFKSDLKKGLKSFDPESEIEAKNIYIVVLSDKSCMCYSYNKANGPHPERYQSTDDITDFVLNDVGFKKLSDVTNN